ncbi:MAG: hypothetical protein WEF86_04625 [Gemmatimonadota bacterium]
MLPARDTLLRNYTALAEGFVYFYLDRRDNEERTLVKTDQVALQLFWAAPDRSMQRIVGLRDASRLPNRMYYHLDHLTVVQDGFGDLIRMGDGDEVRDVPHPAAPGSDSIYEFRLADSLTLQLPSAVEPIRVYELEVRPRSVDRPAIVGSVFVDRGTADIVRMTFTFTPLSYVDDRLDHISVSLDNGLWEGRYWLPNEQTLEIRRQLPELDFAAAAVIQGRMRISDYTFNDTIPASTFIGPTVTTLSRARLEAHEFERGIYDDLNEAGLGTPAQLGDVRRQAAELLGSARLSGLPGWRLGIRSVSSAVRFNRAEGLALGMGIVHDPGPPWRIDLAAGHAFGPDRVWATAVARRQTSQTGAARLRAALRDPRDLGLRLAVPPLINTLSAVALGDDYSDIYYATGARLSFDRVVSGGLRAAIELVAERHRSARLESSSAPLGDSRFRPVLAIDDGDLSAATASISRPVPDGRARSWTASLAAELGTFAGEWYLRPTLDAAFRLASDDHSRAMLLSGSAGAVAGDVPSQRLFLLGGMNTMPGYRHRSFAGTRFGLASLEASAAVLQPWIRLRLIGAAGAVGGLEFGDPAADPEQGEPDPAFQSWGAAATDGLRVSAGAGVSLFWDLLRIDYVRGLNDGESQVMLSFHRDFWDIS